MTHDVALTLTLTLTNAGYSTVTQISIKEECAMKGGEERRMADMRDAYMEDSMDRIVSRRLAQELKKSKVHPWPYPQAWSKPLS